MDQALDPDAIRAANALSVEELHNLRIPIHDIKTNNVFEVTQSDTEVKLESFTDLERFYTLVHEVGTLAERNGNKWTHTQGRAAVGVRSAQDILSLKAEVDDTSNGDSSLESEDRGATSAAKDVPVLEGATPSVAQQMQALQHAIQPLFQAAFHVSTMADVVDRILGANPPAAATSSLSTSSSSSTPQPGSSSSVRRPHPDINIIPTDVRRPGTELAHTVVGRNDMELERLQSARRDACRAALVFKAQQLRTSAQSLRGNASRLRAHTLASRRLLHDLEHIHALEPVSLPLASAIASAQLSSSAAAAAAAAASATSSSTLQKALRPNALADTDANNRVISLIARSLPLPGAPPLPSGLSVATLPRLLEPHNAAEASLYTSSASLTQTASQGVGVGGAGPAGGAGGGVGGQGSGANVHRQVNAPRLGLYRDASGGLVRPGYDPAVAEAAAATTTTTTTMNPTTRSDALQSSLLSSLPEGEMGEAGSGVPEREAVVDGWWSTRWTDIVRSLKTDRRRIMMQLLFQRLAHEAHAIESGKLLPHPLAGAFQPEVHGETLQVHCPGLEPPFEIVRTDADVGILSSHAVEAPIDPLNFSSSSVAGDSFSSSSSSSSSLSSSIRSYRRILLAAMAMFQSEMEGHAEALLQTPLSALMASSNAKAPAALLRLLYPFSLSSGASGGAVGTVTGAAAGVSSAAAAAAKPSNWLTARQDLAFSTASSSYSPQEGTAGTQAVAKEPRARAPQSILSRVVAAVRFQRNVSVLASLQLMLNKPSSLVEYVFQRFVPSFSSLGGRDRDVMKVSALAMARRLVVRLDPHAGLESAALIVSVVGEAPEAFVSQHLSAPTTSSKATSSAVTSPLAYRPQQQLLARVELSGALVYVLTTAPNGSSRGSHDGNDSAASVVSTTDAVEKVLFCVAKFIVER